MAPDLRHLEKLLEEDFDIERGRKTCCDLIWRLHWDKIFANRQFRIIDKRSRGAAQHDGDSSTTGIYINPSELSWLDYSPGASAFLDDLAFPAGNLLPVQLRGFRGTMAERHAENTRHLSALGQRVYDEMALRIYMDKEVCELFQRVQALEGPDVFWGGHVDEEIVDGSSSQSSKRFHRRAVQSTSLSGFGALTVCNFPFFAELRFDDVDERVTFSLERAICDESIELFIYDLQQLVDENEDSGIADIRQKRIALKVAAQQKLRLNVLKQQFCLRAHVCGLVQVEQIDDEIVDGRPNRGFDCLLSDVVVRSSCGARFVSGLDLKSSSYMLLTEVIDDCDSMWSSTYMTQLVHQINEDEVDKAMRRRQDLNTQKDNAFQRKRKCLDFIFHSEIYANSSLELPQLHNLLETKYPALLGKLSTTGSFPTPELVRSMICIHYLRHCGRAHALWFMYWLQYIENNAAQAPRELSFEIDDFNSFLFRSDVVRKIPELANFAFDQTFLRSESLACFWARLEHSRELDALDQRQSRSTLLAQSVEALREAVIEIGGQAHVLPQLQRQQSLPDKLEPEQFEADNEAEQFKLAERRRNITKTLGSMLDDFSATAAADDSSSDEEFKLLVENASKNNDPGEGSDNKDKDGNYTNTNFINSRERIAFKKPDYMRSSFSSKRARGEVRLKGVSSSRLRKRDTNMIVRLNKMLQVAEAQDAVPKVERIHELELGEEETDNQSALGVGDSDEGDSDDEDEEDFSVIMKDIDSVMNDDFLGVNGVNDVVNSVADGDVDYEDIDNDMNNLKLDRRQEEDVADSECIVVDLAFSSDPLVAIRRVSQLDREREARERGWLASLYRALMPFCRAA